MNSEIKKLIARGFAVFPVGRESKIPLVKWRAYAATNEADASALFSKHADANIGIRLGACAAGCIVVVDTDGPEALAEIGERELPATLTVASGRDSTAPGSYRHYYYRWNTERIAPPSSLKWPGKTGHVDLKGEGGYIVAPPSIHANGNAYRFIDENAPIADAPEWLYRFMQARDDAAKAAASAAERATKTVERASGDVEDFAIDYLVNRAEPSIEGSGGRGTLFSTALYLVRGLCLSPENAASLLDSYYQDKCVPPWESKDLLRACKDAQNSSKPMGFALEYVPRSRSEEPTLSDADVNYIIAKEALRKAKPDSTDEALRIMARKEAAKNAWEKMRDADEDQKSEKQESWQTDSEGEPMGGEEEKSEAQTMIERCRVKIEMGSFTEKLPDRDWIVAYPAKEGIKKTRGFLARNVFHLLAGEPGIGKGRFVMQLAACIAGKKNDSAMGLKIRNTQAGKVFLLLGEDDDLAIKERLQAANSEEGFTEEQKENIAKNLHAVSMHGELFTLAEQKQRAVQPSPSKATLDTYLSEHGPWALIVIDTWARFGAGDENDNQAQHKVSAIFESLTKANKKHDEKGPAVLAITHIPKIRRADKEKVSLDDQAMIRGASSISGACRVAFTIGTKSDSIVFDKEGLKASEEGYNPKTARTWSTQELYVYQVKNSLSPEGDPLCLFRGGEGYSELSPEKVRKSLRDVWKYARALDTAEGLQEAGDPGAPRKGKGKGTTKPKKGFLPLSGEGEPEPSDEGRAEA